jgi:hypothetical protein
VLQTARELKRLSPKRIIRGKFEAWFFVEFWKHLIRQMRALAIEAQGNLNVRIQLERSNFVAVLSGRLEIPRSLDLFLGQHFNQTSEFETTEPGPQERKSVLAQAVSLIKRLFT